MKNFLLPPLSLFILIVLGWLIARRWRRIGRALAVLSFVALVVLSAPFVTGWLMQPLQIYPALDPDRLPSGPAAIVILSGDTQSEAPEYGFDIPGPLTLERVRYGAFLHKRTQLPILVSGGRIHLQRSSLARQMQATLTKEFGIPVRWLEERSYDTHQNAALSAEMLRRDGINKVFLVTHAWHMRRSMAAFRATGIEAVPAPTRFIRAPTGIPEDFIPNASSLRGSYYALHEWLGLLWYYVAGYSKSFS
ncbi:MAG TPA: YdcF family protein [Alphaproteobacteria bacterium]|nr:YdcF family protein [Alphaproteobacteria bacterium]